MHYLLKAYRASFRNFFIRTFNSCHQAMAQSKPAPIYSLDVNSAFNSIGIGEKRYAHACSQAAWVGSLIDLLQTSPESGGLFLLFHNLFAVQSPQELRESAKPNVPDVEVDAIYTYVAQFFANMGNYTSFGDTKFVPSVDSDCLTKFLKQSKAFQSAETGLKMTKLWDQISPAVFSLDESKKRLGFAPNGITTYYSSNCNRNDAEYVQSVLSANKIEPYNTRLVKKSPAGDQSVDFHVRVASTDQQASATQLKTGDSTRRVHLELGDYHNLMSILVDACKGAANCANTDVRCKMWSAYTDSFKTGSIDDHKKGSEFWVTDTDPVVETYIGFIETYRDPFGVRGEFEGFVAIVDPIRSANFEQLVSSAPQLLPQLPWPAAYEKDVFMKPAFKSIDVLAFACSGVPLGINIPNYDDIRQNFGFKNVSLGNVISARFKDSRVQYLTDADREIYLTNILVAEEISVGLHELLGHGSGKLFKVDDAGKANFDTTATPDLLNHNASITSWYKPGETYDAKFAGISSAMEECRAECVALYLSNQPKVLSIFATDQSSNKNDIVYTIWLSMARQGLAALEFYTPPADDGDQSGGGWGQAHCCARYVILRAMLAQGKDLVWIEEKAGEDGNPDLCLHLNRDRIVDLGMPAIGDLLKHLQYYRSTGNSEAANAYFQPLSSPTSEHLTMRLVLKARSKPRPHFIQPVTRLVNDSEVQLVNYPATPEGLIQSLVDRFTSTKGFSLADQALDALHKDWLADKADFHHGY